MQRWTLPCVDGHMSESGPLTISERDSFTSPAKVSLSCKDRTPLRKRKRNDGGGDPSEAKYLGDSGMSAAPSGLPERSKCSEAEAYDSLRGTPSDSGEKVPEKMELHGDQNTRCRDTLEPRRLRGL